MVGEKSLTTPWLVNLDLHRDEVVDYKDHVRVSEILDAVIGLFV